MIRHSMKYLLAAGLLIGLLGSAQANQVVVCKFSEPSKAAGPGQIRASSGNTYTTSSRGCAPVLVSDVASFVAQGFSIEPRAIVVSGALATRQVQMPANTFIDRIVVQEVSGAVVTGGLKIGTIASGSDVVLAFTIGGPGTSSVQAIPDSSLQKRSFPGGAAQNLFIDAGSGSWASGPSVNVIIYYGYL